MELIDYFTHFLSTETPFMLLFALLFLYVIKTNKDREKRMADLIEKKIDTMQEELHVLIKVWKVLLEKELEAKKNE